MSEVKFVGLDVFVISQGSIPKLPEKISGCELISITNRGTKVWPGKAPPLEMTDLYTARYQCAQGSTLSDKTALEILENLSSAGQTWVHTEKLLSLNGVNRFT